MKVSPVNTNPEKVEKVMGEFKGGMLHSGSDTGPLVKNRKQAVAIALNSARKEGDVIPDRLRKFRKRTPAFAQRRMGKVR
jgi:hypothetical protein